MIDSGAFDDPRVKGWLFPGEQPHTKNLAIYNDDPRTALHGPKTLDILLDQRNGAPLADLVSVRRSAKSGLESLVDTINQIGHDVRMRGATGHCVLNWAVMWAVRGGDEGKWVKRIRDRNAQLTRRLGAVSVVAVANSLSHDFVDLPELLSKTDPMITVRICKFLTNVILIDIVI